MENSNNKISQGLVINDFLLYSLSYGYPLGLSHVILDLSAVERNLFVGDILKFLMTFVQWVDKMLNLSHLKLSYS